MKKRISSLINVNFHLMHFYFWPQQAGVKLLHLVEVTFHFFSAFNSLT
jgi:hypothetical protein